MKYLKTWMGYVTGSPGGREDGYPELKIAVFASDEQLAGHPTHRDEKIYALTELDESTVTEIVGKARAITEENRQADERAKKEALYEQLGRELGK